MKNSEQNQLDQVLKDRLSEGTAPVPDFVWDRIEEELFPGKKRRGFFWWLFGGLSVLIIGILLAVAFSGESVHSQQASLAQEHVSESFQPASYAQQKEPGIRTSNKKDFTAKATASGNGKLQQKIRQQTAATVARNASGKQSVRIVLPGKTPVRSALSPEQGKQAALQTGSQDRSKDSQPQPGERNPVTLFGSKDKLEESGVHSGNDPERKVEATESKAWSYAGILELVKRDFAENPLEVSEEKPYASVFSLGVFGGPSLYNAAVLKDYFTSGQLSKRTFAASGWELGLQARFKVGNRVRVYAGFAFNHKQTEFTYDLAITQADYFTYLANGGNVPLAHIRDDGANSCFLAKDVHVRYRTQAALLSLGGSFEFLRIGKFSAAADLRLTCNVYSSLKLEEVSVLQIDQPRAEQFSYFQPGAGLSLNYQLTKRLSLGIAPFFSKQFAGKESFSRKLDELVVPVTVSFDF